MFQRNLKKGLSKNRITFFLVLFNLSMLVCSLVIMSSINTVQAWSNKRSDIKFPSEHWEDWSAYDRDLDYATHDWIADFAVEYITSPLHPNLRIKWYDANGAEFWTPRRIKIFLYGTAGPDMNKVQFTSRNRQIVYGPGDSRTHYIHFDSVSKEVEDANAGIRAQLFAHYAITAFKNGDCDLAAFFLGEMTHYISDMSMYYHVISETSNTHYQVEYWVAQRTSGRFKGSDPYVHGNREYFFKVWDTFNLINDRDVTQIAISLAFDTRFNPIGPNDYGTLDAYTLVDLGEEYGLGLSKNWPKDREAWINYQTSEYWYFYRLEQNLNSAIQHVASALDWVITQVQSYQCKANTLEQVLEDTVSVAFVKTTLLSIQQITSLIGLYASLSSVSITATVGKFK